jgi:putative FmdB family regulatory protein
MPFYDYECSSCGQRYSRRKPMSQRDADTCDCGGAAKKSISAPAGAFVRGGGAAAHAGRRSPVRTQRKTAGPANLTREQVDSLPVVGRDGKLYSSDGKNVIRE